MVRPCRTFLRRTIDFLTRFYHRSHTIRLNLEFCRYLHWWLFFFQAWNGISFFLRPEIAQLPDLFVASVAAGSTGFGAMWCSRWFFCSWSFPRRHNLLPSWSFSLSFLPLILWSTDWFRLQVQFVCDNSSVVDVHNAGSYRSSCLMHLLRNLTHVACKNSFSFSARHTPGRSNVAAETLSRFHFQEFHRLVPGIYHDPSPIPPALLQSLIDR